MTVREGCDWQNQVMCLYSRGKEAWESSLELSARKGAPELSVVAHAYNSSTQGSEEGGSGA